MHHHETQTTDGTTQLSDTMQSYVQVISIEIACSHGVHMSGYGIRTFAIRARHLNGHMIRADDTYLMKKVMLNVSDLTQREPTDTRISGRPRCKWVDTICYAFTDPTFGEYDTENVPHQETLKKAAHDRKL